MTRLVALLLTVLTGFSAFVYEVTWRKCLTTLLGPHGEGDHRAVRSAAQNAPYRIGDDRIEDFPPTVAAYRFRKLADFDAADADRFELILPAEGDQGA